MNTSHNISSICVFGGGTSGWLTAAYLLAKIPKHIKIIVVESSTIGIIGVGEGTQPYTAQFLREAEIPEHLWMKNADATYKLGVEFEGWHDRNYFVDNDSFDVHMLAPDTLTHKFWSNKPAQEFVDWLPAYRIAKANRSPKLGSSKFDYSFGMMAPSWDAMHFNAYKIGESIKNYIKDRVTLYDVVIKKVEHNDEGVQHLVTENDEIIRADVYIDCTGFRSMLLEETLEEPHISIENLLPNDSAVAIPTQYIDPKAECHPYTKATTMKAGWRWTIPTYSRIGNGYVYSSKYITKDEAEQELREAIGEHSAEARHLKMKCGYKRQVAKNNVLAVGLSAGFVEPLEATGITFTTKAVEFFVDAISENNGIMNEQVRSTINQKFYMMFSEIVNFIWLHYHYSSRKDTTYWKDVTNRPIPDHVKGVQQEFVPTPPDFVFKDDTYSMFHSGQWFEMLHGSSAYNGVINMTHKNYEDYAQIFVDNRSQLTDEIIKKFPNHWEYLNGVYNGIH